MNSQLEALIHGSVAPGFEPVAEAFTKNFTDRREVGAACAVYHRGEKVVDLWGGYRNKETQEPWEEDTMLMFFSTTKGVSAMTMAVALSRGLFELDKPIAHYWPEFGQNGKERITVRQLLAHQAGLIFPDQNLTIAEMANPDTVAAIMARQKPGWDPGTRHGYHAITLGWYQSELIRRTDPEHRTLGQFLRDNVVRPLGLEFYIGLPESVPASRVADFDWTRKQEYFAILRNYPLKVILSMMKSDAPLRRAIMVMEMPKGTDWRPLHRVEVPSATGVGEVRAIAHMYGVFATGGAELGITPAVMQELKRPAQAPSGGTVDTVIGMETGFSMGFMKPCRFLRFGTDDSVFGTPGFGGSFGFADPVAQLGFAYACNSIGFHPASDPREKALRDAVYQCIHQL